MPALLLADSKIRLMPKKRKMRGVVRKVIKPAVTGDGEKAEIAIDEADDLYKEIRIENSLIDDKGEKKTLKPGEEVDVIVEADTNANLKKPN